MYLYVFVTVSVFYYKCKLIKMIEGTGIYKKYYEKDNKELNIEELKERYNYYSELKEKQDKILAIKISPEDSEIEDYLIKDYSVIQDTEYLKCEEQIKEYFSEDYREFFDCGQGYYQDIAEIIIKIAKKYYNVKVYAEIVSAKQDIGDRLYWVEDIKKVEFKEIDKPKKNKKKNFKFEIELSENNKSLVEKFLNDNEINYLIKLN